MDAISTLSLITGAATGVANLTSDDAETQQAYQLELMKRQNEYNRAAAERQMAMQKEMYEYTGFGSKVRQLKEAGLNPGLIYGMGSAGGGVTGNTSAAQTGLGSAPNVASSRATRLQSIGMSLELAKLKSEIEVNESVADANRAKAGLDTSLNSTEGLKQIGIDLDNQLKTINVGIEGKTVEDRITAIKAASDKAVYEAMGEIGTMKSKQAQASIDINTIDDQISIVNLSIAKAYAEIAALKSGITLNDAKRNEIANSIQQAWLKSEYDSAKTNAEIKKIMQEYLNNDLSNSEKEINDLVSKLIPSVNYIPGLKGKAKK